MQDKLQVNAITKTSTVNMKSMIYLVCVWIRELLQLIYMLHE